MKKVSKSIVGIDRFILSKQEYKRVLLTSQLNLVFFTALFCFIINDIIIGFFYPIPYLLVGLFICCIVIVLNKKGHFTYAKIVLSVGVNLLALFFTASLIRDLGLFVFSICINTGVFVVFGYEKIRLSMLIVIISVGLFLIAMFHPFPRISSELVSSGFVNYNISISFLISNAASAIIIYYLLIVNYKVESSLITKEKILEEKNGELIKVNSELDKFFYSTSHDMRAPLTSIQGLIHLMEISNDPEELKTYTSMLKGRTENLDMFLKGISEYSANSTQALNLKQLNLKSVLRENLENFKFYPKASLIKIYVEVSSELIIISDPVRLQIIFGNILANAIKYHDYSKVNPFIKVTAHIEKESIQVIIEDNGTGIEEKNLPSIFGMFYRATQQSEGSGLGLYIVKEAIDKLNGHIAVASVYKEGTTFTISLPHRVSN